MTYRAVKMSFGWAIYVLDEHGESLPWAAVPRHITRIFLMVK